METIFTFQDIVDINDKNDLNMNIDENYVPIWLKLHEHLRNQLPQELLQSLPQLSFDRYDLDLDMNQLEERKIVIQAEKDVILNYFDEASVNEWFIGDNYVNYNAFKDLFINQKIFISNELSGWTDMTNIVQAISKQKEFQDKLLVISFEEDDFENEKGCIFALNGVCKVFNSKVEQYTYQDVIESLQSVSQKKLKLG